MDNQNNRKTPFFYSFRFIIAILIFVSALIPICLLGYFSFNKFEKALIDQTNENTKVLVKQVNTSLYQYIEGINNIIEVSSDQPGLIKLIEKTEDSDFIKNAKLFEDPLHTNNPIDKEIFKLTRNIIKSIKKDPDIFTAYIGTRSHHMFSDEDSYIYGINGDFDCVTREWYKKASINKTKVIWTNPYIDRQTEDLVVTGAKAIYREDELYGVFAIDIVLNDFISRIGSLNSNKIGSIFIIDKQNNYVVHHDKNMIGKSMKDELSRMINKKYSGEYKNDEYVYVFETNNITNWKVIARYSRNILFEKVNVIKFFIYQIFGIFLIVIILISYLLSKRIYQPIRSITEHLKVITEGGFDREVPKKLMNRKDEIGFLSNAVQTMQDNISKLIYDITDLSEEILETQKEVVITLGEIAETRSLEMGFHIKRVAEYSYFLAKKLGISEEEARTIQMAATLHDVGKIGIPDSILNKPGKFTSEEYRVMQSHTNIGYNMLKRSNRAILRAAAIIAREHHEKFDGTGYPRRIKGYEIHLYARIVALVDVFDALGTARVYKEAWSMDQILTFINEQRGKHFDPKIVDIFLENIDSILEIRNKLSKDNNMVNRVEKRKVTLIK